MNSCRHCLITKLCCLTTLTPLISYTHNGDETYKSYKNIKLQIVSLFIQATGLNGGNMVHGDVNFILRHFRKIAKSYC